MHRKPENLTPAQRAALLPLEALAAHARLRRRPQPRRDAAWLRDNVPLPPPPGATAPPSGSVHPRDRGGVQGGGEE